MSDSNVFVGGHSEDIPLGTRPWRFAAAVSLGLHVVIVVAIAGGSRPVGVDSGVTIDVVDIEFVVPDGANAVPPSIVGKLAAAGSRQEGAAQPNLATIEQTPDSDVAAESVPLMATTPPPKAPLVIEPPVTTTIPDSAITVSSVSEERTRPNAEAPGDRRPTETSTPSPDNSSAKATRIDHPPPIPKPTASDPKPPAIKHPADGRAPKSGHRPQPNPRGFPADRTANFPSSTGPTGSAEADQAVAGRHDALALYLASIRSRIAGQQYRVPGDERGRVEIRFSVAADGRFGDLKVERSDNDLLEEEALKIVRRCSPAAPIPPSTGKTSLTMSITIEFK